MVRVNLTAEGKTEQVFAVDVLKPHLAERGVYIVKPRLAAHAKKKGRVHRGGLDNYLPARNDIVRWLKQDQAPDVYFTTMFDLYALPNDFPGYDVAKEKNDPYDRVAALEMALREDIDDPRFIPYIQLHEFEALLLSDPSEFAYLYKDYDKKIKNLESLCEDYDTPEKINHRQHLAPSKRIGKEIPEYVDAKATAGPIIAARIGLAKIREKCPHFNEWLTRLERLAT